MRNAARNRGPAGGGAPLRCLAIALALACVAASPGPAAARRPAPLPGAPEAGATLAFPGLAWDAGPAAVARALEARGFARVPDGDPGTWRGEAFGRRVRLGAETDRGGMLVAVTLRFDADTRGGTLQRYESLVEAVRRRHGAWSVQVAPERTVHEEHFGHAGVTRRYGPRTAVTLWADDSGAAAAVQLDGDGVIWLRYESPRWEDVTREQEDAGR